jgi:hypothetical protein
MYGHIKQLAEAEKKGIEVNDDIHQILSALHNTDSQFARLPVDLQISTSSPKLSLKKSWARCMLPQRTPPSKLSMTPRPLVRGPEFSFFFFPHSFGYGELTS